MNMTEQISLTLRIVSHGHFNNWRAYAALLGMLAMIGGMVAMMWFLSSQAPSDMRGWLCGGASVIGLALWRSMLPLAYEQDRRDEARR